MSVPRVSTLILGAGPTGLGAARRLFELDADLAFLVIDEQSGPGGRAGSHRTPEGFTFDYGGHVLFPHAEYTQFLAEADEAVTDWHRSTPIRGIWCNDQSIPTPIQKNLHRLGFSEMLACLWGLYKREPLRVSNEEPNLEAFLEANFGQALTKKIMGPLNFKMWATNPDRLGSTWSQHRSGSREVNIPHVQISSVIKNWITRRDEPGWTPDTRVRYPLRGGTGALWQGIADRLPHSRKRFGVRVTAVDGIKKQVTLSDGTSIAYDRLISSIPLDSLMRLMGRDSYLSAKADQFRAARVQIFGFGVVGPQPDVLRGVHAISIPDPGTPFWRVNVPSNFSPGNTPGGDNVWSLLCECSLAPESKTVYTHKEIERELRSLGLIPSGTKVISLFETSLDHGYPVPFLGRDQLLDEVQSTLERMDIYSRGRFGGWRYEVSNQDHAYMQGIEVVERLADGSPEYTYRKTWD